MIRDFAGLRVAVIGAGAFGLTTALFAARRGACVTLHAANPLEASASAVAAGMLSPVFETLEASGDPALFALLQAGLQTWDDPDLPRPQMPGALYVGPDMHHVADALTRWNVAWELLDARRARRLWPGLSAKLDAALYTCTEARVSPQACLGVMVRALHDRGVAVDPTPVPIGDAFQVWRREVDAVVIAAGYGSRLWADHAAVLSRLTPIKGHILQFQGGPRDGPTLRTRDGYVAPQPDGALFGASMQRGCADLRIEPQVVETLRSHAVALAPELADVAFTARTGVRAATPDGLPLAGCLEEGLFTATGARRNGWLLAPLVAQTVVAALAGETAPCGHAFDPGRFG